MPALFVVLSLLAAQAVIAVEEEEFSTKVIGGKDAPSNQFTFTAAIEYSEGHKCTGSILTTKYILTAAHCCQSAPDYRYITTGSHNRSLQEGEIPNIVKRFMVHKDYHGGGAAGMNNDICIAELTTPLQLGPHLTQTILANNETDIPENSPVTVMGWGYANAAKTLIPEWLQYDTGYHVFSSKWCHDNVVDTTGAHTQSDFGGKICVFGQPGRTVCQGDSGGPVLMNNIQIGVFSYYTTPCGTPGPDYYTKVPEYVEWIKEQLGTDANQLKISGDNTQDKS